MKFNEFVGQQEAKDQLLYGLRNDQVFHAYMFSGPAGIGKKTLGRVFASALLCEEPDESGACGKCKSCILMRDGSHPDFFSIVVDASKRDITVDSVRDLFKDIEIKPLISKRKVYIIPSADKMNKSAQNSILKTLEEPLGYAVIILTASKREALLDTIKSRVKEVLFKRNTIPEVESYLDNLSGTLKKTGGQASGEEAENPKHISEYMDHRTAAILSEGVIGEAVNIFSSPHMNDLRNSVIMNLPLLFKGDNEEFKSIILKYKEDYQYIFKIMQSCLRDMFIYAKVRDENVLINYDKKDIIIKCADSVDKYFIEKCIELVENVSKSLTFNTNFNGTIDYMVINFQEN